MASNGPTGTKLKTKAKQVRTVSKNLKAVPDNGIVDKTPVRVINAAEGFTGVLKGEGSIADHRQVPVSDRSQETMHIFEANLVPFFFEVPSSTFACPQEVEGILAVQNLSSLLVNGLASA